MGISLLAPGLLIAKANILWDFRTSDSILLYRDSKMCRGMIVSGNNVALGNIINGILSGIRTD